MAVRPMPIDVGTTRDVDPPRLRDGAATAAASADRRNAESRRLTLLVTLVGVWFRRNEDQINATVVFSVRRLPAPHVTAGVHPSNSCVEPCRHLASKVCQRAGGSLFGEFLILAYLPPSVRPPHEMDIKPGAKLIRYLIAHEGLVFLLWLITSDVEVVDYESICLVPALSLLPLPRSCRKHGNPSPTKASLHPCLGCEQLSIGAHWLRARQPAQVNQTRRVAVEVARTCPPQAGHR